MRSVLLGVLVVCAACAASPAPEPARPAPALGSAAAVSTASALPSFSYEDADLAAVASDLSAISGLRISVQDGVRESVTISLCRIPWRDAAELIAKMTRCELVEQPDGSLVFEQPAFMTLKATDVSLPLLVRLVCAFAGGSWVQVAADVKGSESIDFHECGTSLDRRRFCERFLVEHGLHVRVVGDVHVVARAPLESVRLPGTFDGTGLASETASYRAWEAPAAGWFALLERATGLRAPEHGAAPIDVLLPRARTTDVLLATVLLSHVEAPKKPLADMPEEAKLSSGRRIAFMLEATVTGIERPMALVDGRVLAVGDELAPGVTVSGIEDDALLLEEKGVVTRVKRSD